ncbi:DUF4815 domain-containing protein [Wolbachia endosymbiont of Listronotus oregonensis]|nr:DUF4815 domain-containing protein [Wolbachia endosymbiont of Listronotus oregonensis]
MVGTRKEKGHLGRDILSQRRGKSGNLADFRTHCATYQNTATRETFSFVVLFEKKKMTLNSYYNRFNPDKEYEKSLFLAGRGLQSAELNETQEYALLSLKA